MGGWIFSEKNWFWEVPKYRSISRSTFFLIFFFHASSLFHASSCLPVPTIQGNHPSLPPLSNANSPRTINQAVFLLHLGFQEDPSPSSTSFFSRSKLIAIWLIVCVFLLQGPPEDPSPRTKTPLATDPEQGLLFKGLISPFKILPREIPSLYIFSRSVPEIF